MALQDSDKPLTFLNIYDAPHELSDAAIVDRLTPYCEVIQQSRGKFQDPEGVFNGIRHYRVRIHQPIPSYLRFGQTRVVLKHDNQQETCKHCNRTGQYAHLCTAEICFNCDEIGHQACSCENPNLCSICREPEHKARMPFSWNRPVMRVTPTNGDEHVDIEAVDSPESELTPGADTSSSSDVDKDINYISAVDDLPPLDKTDTMVTANKGDESSTKTTNKPIPQQHVTKKAKPTPFVVVNIETCSNSSSTDYDQTKQKG